MHSPRVSETALEDQVATVVRRLASSLDVPAADIEEEVRRAFEEWGEARVRDFIPIFVERSIRARLATAQT